MTQFCITHVFLLAMIGLQIGGLAQAVYQGNPGMALIMGGVGVANVGTLLLALR